jgi:hypothetical protein
MGLPHIFLGFSCKFSQESQSSEQRDKTHPKTTEPHLAPPEEAAMARLRSRGFKLQWSAKSFQFSRISCTFLGGKARPILGDIEAHCFSGECLLHLDS